MVDEQKLRELADNLICHPVSRSIDEIEAAGESIKSLLDELQTLRSERTAWRVTAENAEPDAARYRHLCDFRGQRTELCFDGESYQGKDEFDAAIDAAIKGGS